MAGEERPDRVRLYDATSPRTALADSGVVLALRSTIIDAADRSIDRHIPKRGGRLGSRVPPTGGQDRGRLLCAQVDFSDTC